MLRHLPLACAALLVSTSAGFAQTDPMAQARTAAYNQVGVMEYCQAKGYADTTAVASQRATLARLPAGPVTPEMDAAETIGKSGTIASPNGTNTTLAEMAGKTNTTEAALCGRLADNAKLMTNATATGLPAMPTMPGGIATVPGMPNMPGMPTTPPSR